MASTNQTMRRNRPCRSMRCASTCSNAPRAEVHMHAGCLCVRRNTETVYDETTPRRSRCRKIIQIPTRGCACEALIRCSRAGCAARTLPSYGGRSGPACAFGAHLGWETQSVMQI
jgi:hypothetical protein